MKKKLEFRNILLRFKGLFVLGASDIISGAITSLFWLYITTLVDVESYGKISYLIAIASIATTISLIGSRNTVTVYVAKNIKLESTVFFLVLIFGSIISLIIFLMYHDLGLSLYVFGAAIFSLGGSAILGKKLFTTYSKYVIVQKILWFGLSLGLYQLIGVNGIVIGMGLSFFVYVIIIIKTFHATKINFSLLRPHFGFFINSYAIDILSTLNKQVDKIIIAPLLGLILLANYQLGLQFIAIFQLLPMIVLKYTLPHDATGNPNKNLKITMILVSGCFTVLVIVITPIIIPLFFQKFIYVIEVIQILSLSLIPFSLATTYFSKFFGNEYSKLLLINLILYLSSFLLAALIIGNIMGITGIATAYVISAIISAIFLLILDQRNKINT